MAIQNSTQLTAALNAYLSNLSATIDNAAPVIYPNADRGVREEVAVVVQDLIDSHYNKSEGLTISDVVGLVTALAGKETKDTTILKQADVRNNLVSVDTNKPLSAAQGKVLKDLIDALPSANNDDYLDFGGANQVSATEIKTHINDATKHFLQTAIDHTVILNRGTNTHAQIDTHIGDSTKHFLQSEIDHTNLLNIGSNTHAQIDTHIANTSNPHSTTLNQVINAAGLSLTKGTIYVANGSAIVAVGVGINGQVIKADSSQSSGIVWSSDIGEANILASVGSGQSLSVGKVGDELRIRSLSSTSGLLTIATVSNEVQFTLNQNLIDHQSITGAGTNTHAQIDTHIANTSNPHHVTLDDVIGEQSLPLTKGTLYVANGSTVFNLDVGADGQVIKANSSTASGLEWSDDTNEANDGVNLAGSGSRVFTNKSGVNLQFRRLNSTSASLTIAENVNQIDFTIVPSSITHSSLSGVGTNTHAQIDTHIGNTSNPHNVTKTQIGLSAVPNIDATDVDNHVNGSSNKVYTAAEQTKLSGIATSATANVEQAALTNTALTSLDVSAFTIGGDYVLQEPTTSTPYGFVTLDEAKTVLHVIQNLQLRVNELEAKLVSADILVA